MKRARSLSWRVFATSIADGSTFETFRIGAPTEAEALEKARAHFGRGDSFDPASARVERVRR